MQPPPILPAQTRISHSRDLSLASSADGSEWIASAGSARARIEDDAYREKVLRSDDELDDHEEYEEESAGSAASAPPARALPMPADDEDSADDWCVLR